MIKAGAEHRSSCTYLFKNGSIMPDILPDLLFSDIAFLSHSDMCRLSQLFLRLSKRWILNRLWLWIWRLWKDNSAKSVYTYSRYYSIN